MENCGNCRRTAILIVFGVVAQMTPFAHTAAYPLETKLTSKRITFPKITDVPADDGYLDYQSGVRYDEYPKNLNSTFWDAGFEILKRGFDLPYKQEIEQNLNRGTLWKEVEEDDDGIYLLGAPREKNNFEPSRPIIPLTSELPVKIVVPKRAALILDRILKEIESAKDSNQIINDWSPISRRGNNKDKLYFRCYFNAVSCYRRK